ncbi:MAG: hypothetical protein QOH22_2160 [Gemmatimonadaceae bacterium]|nr:hypothetical protein [Gemmatimonadaceae bacterium]
MQTKLRIVLVAGAGLIAAACASDMTTSPAASRAAVAALVAPPISFDQIRTSFVGRSSETDGFVPGGTASGGDDDDADHQAGERGPGWGGLMGGGLGEAWIGGIGFGPGLGRGPFGDFDDSNSCAFSATSSRVECTAVTRAGLTVNRSFSFLDAAGAVEQAFDAAKTNTVNVKNSVSGTVTHHSTATSTVNSSSDFTVVGLASGSTQRTVNGKSAGSETTTGTKDGVAFTVARTAGDTTTGLVIPIQSGVRTYPTAGTVIRSMQATVTPAGSAASTSSRREVITYDGSATATVVITHDGVTKNCTKPLPHGRLSCA